MIFAYTMVSKTLTTPEMLGRMLGFEYSITRLSEAVMSFTAGRLEDIGYGKHEIASLSACVGGMMFAFWSIYHIFGGGAANKKFRKVATGIIGNNQLELQVTKSEGVV